MARRKKSKFVLYFPVLLSLLTFLCYFCFLYNNGHSIRYILENTEFKYFRIYRILTNAGIEIRRTNKKKLDMAFRSSLI